MKVYCFKEWRAALVGSELLRQVRRSFEITINCCGAAAADSASVLPQGGSLHRVASCLGRGPAWGSGKRAARIGSQSR